MLIAQELDDALGLLVEAAALEFRDEALVGVDFDGVGAVGVELQAEGEQDFRERSAALEERAEDLEEVVTLELAPRGKGFELVFQFEQGGKVLIGKLVVSEALYKSGYSGGEGGGEL